MNLTLIFGFQGPIGPTRDALGGPMGLGTPIAPQFSESTCKNVDL